MAHSYPFIPASQRAQCVNVVDGDTVDLFMDDGKRRYSLERYRLLAIDTYELNSKDPAQRDLAEKAKITMLHWCKPVPKTSVNLEVWPLRCVTHKSPDSFGRWLVDIYFTDDAGVEHHANAELVEMGLAVPYSR